MEGKEETEKKNGIFTKYTTRWWEKMQIYKKQAYFFL